MNTSASSVEHAARHASIYRMVTKDHICPFGLKAKDLLERKGFEVEVHLLRSREETDRFQQAHHVETTPQVFIGGERIGGYERLRSHLGLSVAKPDGTSYQPVIAVFSIAFLMAVLPELAQQFVWLLAVRALLL